MKAYPSDLESVVQRTIPITDWPVNSDNTSSGQGKRYAVRGNLTPGSPVNFRMRRYPGATGRDDQAKPAPWLPAGSKMTHLHHRSRTPMDRLRNLPLSPERCSRSGALCAEAGGRPRNLTFKRCVYTRRAPLYNVYSDGHAEGFRDRNLRLGVRWRAFQGSPFPSRTAAESLTDRVVFRQRRSSAKFAQPRDFEGRQCRRRESGDRAEYVGRDQGIESSSRRGFADLARFGLRQWSDAHQTRRSQCDGQRQGGVRLLHQSHADQYPDAARCDERFGTSGRQ